MSKVGLRTPVIFVVKNSGYSGRIQRVVWPCIDVRVNSEQQEQTETRHTANFKSSDAPGDSMCNLRRYVCVFVFVHAYEIVADKLQFSHVSVLVYIVRPKLP